MKAAPSLGGARHACEEESQATFNVYVHKHTCRGDASLNRDHCVRMCAHMKEYTCYGRLFTSPLPIFPLVCRSMSFSVVISCGHITLFSSSITSCHHKISKFLPTIEDNTVMTCTLSR